MLPLQFISTLFGRVGRNWRAGLGWKNEIDNHNSMAVSFFQGVPSFSTQRPLYRPVGMPIDNKLNSIIFSQAC